jgi:hypothetical protein
LNKKRIHIDQLFKNGLKNLSFLVSSKDFESIDKKTEAFSDQNTQNIKDQLDGMSFPISDLDWEQTFSKLQKEKLALEPASSSPFASLQDISIPINDEDWIITKKKLAQEKRKRVLIWWKVASLFLLIGVLAIVYQSISRKMFDQNQQLTESVPRPSKSLIEKQNNVTQKIEVNTEVNKNSYLTSKNKLYKNTNSIHQTQKPSILKQALNTEIKIEKAAGETYQTETDIFTLNKIGLQTFENIFSFELIEKITPLTIRKPSVKIIKTHFYIGLNNALFTNQFKYDKNNDANFNTLQQNADVNLLSWSKGINFGVLHKGFQHQISINGQQINQKSNYQFTFKIYDSIPVKDPNGNIINYFLTRGRDTTTQESHLIKRNRLDLSYNTNKIWKISPKFNFVTGLGALASLNLNSKGHKTLDPNSLKISDYQSIKRNERTLGFHPMVYLGVQTSLSKNWILETAFSSQYNLLPVYKSNIYNKINTYQSGIHVKILYLIK